MVFSFFKRRSTTGKFLTLAPIAGKDIASFREEITSRVYSHPLRNVTERSMIEYAFCANLFAGNYQVVLDKKDEGFKPILVPIGYSPNKESVDAKIIFPNEIVRRTPTSSSRFQIDNSHLDIANRTSPIIFCSFPIGPQQVPARIYLYSNSQGSIFEKLSSARKTHKDVRDGFDFRLYDVQLTPQGETFSFKEWEI